MLKRIMIVCFLVVMTLGFNVNAAQTPEELQGTPSKYFFNDFESYETNMAQSLSKPYGYQYSSRVANGYGGTESSVYTANAAENIPVFNNNAIVTSTTNGYYIDKSTNTLVAEGTVATQYIGESITLLITYKDFDVANPDPAKIKYLIEDVVGRYGKYKFSVPWTDEDDVASNYDVKVYVEDSTIFLGQTEKHAGRISVYNPELTEIQYEEKEDNVYAAESPTGNVVYGGLKGYYGWFGGALFENYPDPYSSGFKVDLEPRTSLGPNEQRLAVINEVKGDDNSNKLLIMDALYLGGNTNNDGRGCSQTAVFGKHNLDFSGNTVIEFRVYPYLIGGSSQGFKMYLTSGDYNMSYNPTFIYDEETGLSAEYHTAENYTGSYFASDRKYELFRLSNSDLTSGDCLYMFKIAGAESRVAGYEFVSADNTPPTTMIKTGESITEMNLPADKYYDIRIEIDRYDDFTRLYFEVKDIDGEVIFTTAPNGVAWNVPELGEFLAETNQKYGIVFEAHSSAWSGPYERTKVGIDNLKFYKNDYYVVRNAWLSSKNGVGNLYVDIYNYSGQDTTACLYAAVYDKKKQTLEAIVTKNIEISTLSPAENIVLGELELPQDFDAEKHTVKLFVLKDNRTLAPILESKQINELY